MNKPMITISTMELRRLISDVIPFAGTDEDFPAMNCVRLEWAGDHLVVQATNGFAVAERTWTPDDEEHDIDGDTEPLVALYEVDPYMPAFKVRISLLDAQNIVKAYTLKGKKKQFAPVGINVEVESAAENTYRVVFHRESGGPSWTPLTFKASGRGAPRPHTDDAPETDLRDLMRRYNNIEAHVPSLWWSPKLLGAFGKVSNHGPLEMYFTGEDETVRWKMGERFHGLIQPVRQKQVEPNTEDVPFDFDSEDDDE